MIWIFLILRFFSKGKKLLFFVLFLAVMFLTACSFSPKKSQDHPPKLSERDRAKKNQLKKNHKGFKKQTLKVLSYSSFAGVYGPGRSLKKKFESFCSCQLLWFLTEDSRALLQQFNLIPDVDIVIGWDQLSLRSAEGAEWEDLSKLKNQLVQEKFLKQKGFAHFNQSPYFLPFSWSPIGFIYRDRDKSVKSLKLLYQVKGRISFPEPRSSSLGLQLYYWIYELMEGDKKQITHFLKKLKKKVYGPVFSWSLAYGFFQKGKTDMGLSYLSSLIYHESKNDRGDKGRKRQKEPIKPLQEEITNEEPTDKEEPTDRRGKRQKEPIKLIHEEILNEEPTDKRGKGQKKPIEPLQKEIANEEPTDKKGKGQKKPIKLIHEEILNEEPTDKRGKWQKEPIEPLQKEIANEEPTDKKGKFQKEPIKLIHEEILNEEPTDKRGKWQKKPIKPYREGSKKKEMFFFAQFEEGHPLQMEFISIAKTSKNKQTALQFAEFLLSKEMQELILNQHYMFPVSKASEAEAQWADTFPLLPAKRIDEFMENREELLKLWEEIMY